MTLMPFALSEAMVVADVSYASMSYILTLRLVFRVPEYWIWNEVPGVGSQTEDG